MPRKREGVYCCGSLRHTLFCSACGRNLKTGSVLHELLAHCKNRLANAHAKQAKAKVVATWRGWVEALSYHLGVPFHYEPPPGPPPREEAPAAEAPADAAPDFEAEASFE